MLYLDHNATSPLRPEARSAMSRAAENGGNPSSVHVSGRAARAAIEDARDSIASLVSRPAKDVIFTSGGTEANALALWGAIHGALEAEARFTRIFVSAVEHPSVIANAAAIAERVPGVRVMEIPVTVEGIVNTGALQIMLREGKGRTLVATMAVNNETGVIQPLDAITAHVREAGALLLVDAVQAAGKMPVSFDADYLTLSGHKLGALQGVGALIVKESAPFAALVRGGGQERGKRAGTENVVGIASFGAVAGVPLDLANLAGLRDRFEAGLRARWTDTIVFGGTAPRIANTSNFAIPGLTAEIALMALDLDGICVSSGAACSSGKVGASPVLTAMGVADNLADCALRVSFGWNSQEADVDALLASLEKLIARARPRAAA